MFSPKTIVVGYDGSESARRAVATAAGLVPDNGTVHIVTAYEPPSPRAVEATYAEVPVEYHGSVDVLSEHRDTAGQASAIVSEAERSCVEHIVPGNPADAILRCAAETDAELVIVGSRGLGRAAQVLRGSVSTRIAHHSEVDFMVVH